jgi:hypothetical protein
VLEDHPDFPANKTKFALIGRGDIASVPQDATLGRFNQAIDTAQQGRFTGTTQANND